MKWERLTKELWRLVDHNCGIGQVCLDPFYWTDVFEASKQGWLTIPVQFVKTCTMLQRLQKEPQLLRGSRTENRFNISCLTCPPPAGWAFQQIRAPGKASMGFLALIFLPVDLFSVTFRGFLEPVMMIDLTGSLKEMSKLVLKAVFVAWNWKWNQWLSGAADYFSTIPSNCKRLKTLFRNSPKMQLPPPPCLL